MKDLDKELHKNPGFAKCNYGKGISKLKHFFDEWATVQLAERDVTDFKLAYFRFIYNIDATKGTTNSELAKQAHITKQGMGQVLKELEENKYIKTSPNPDDKRSSIIHLTDKGKEFILSSRACTKELQTKLEKHIGKKKINTFIETMFEIIEYHESLQKEKSRKK